jgi:hypothetical protein
MKQLEELRNQLEWKEQEMEHIFFPVLEEENIILNGKIKTGKKTLYKETPKGYQVISTMGDGYSIVPNQKIHDAIMEADSSLELNTSLSSYHNGKSNLVYDIRNKNADIDINSDEGLTIKLIVINSYNGVKAVEFEMGAFRLKCKNGLSVPIGKTIKMRQKHIGIDESFYKNVKTFVCKTLNEENFKAIKDRIVKSKENESCELPMILLKSLPVNQLLPVLEGIKKYSTNPVKTSFYNKEYDLTKESDNTSIKEMLLDRKEKSERGKKRTRTEEAKVLNMRYNEKISNMWLLYNFIIKIVQFKVKQHKRWEMARKISKMML